MIGLIIIALIFDALLLWLAPVVLVALLTVGIVLTVIAGWAMLVYPDKLIK